MPGWTEHVEQSKRRAIFWHWLWEVNGSPRHRHVAQIGLRRATRAKYHYAVREVKRDQERIVANKITESLYECKPTQFWDHVNKVRGSKNVIPNNVYNIIGFKGISDLFALKYNDLYNSVSNTVDDCSSMKTQLNNICSVDCSCGGKCNVTCTHNRR